MFNFKKLPILVLIDFIVLGLFFYFTKYVIQTVREYYQIIQNLTPEIDKFGFVLQQNTSMLDINDLGENLEIISQMSTKIFLLFILLGLVSFLLYNISQSVSWNLSLNDFKLTNYKKYLKKFTLINIPSFIVLVYLIFNLIVRLRLFILDFWFESYFNLKAFFIILLISLITLILIYLKFELYKLINKHPLKDSLHLLRKRFYKNYLNFGLFLVTVFVCCLLFILIIRINPESVILLIIGVLCSLTIFNIFRSYFTNYF